MIKIEIKDATKARREISRKTDGKIITFYEQPAWAYTYGKNGQPNPYPESITLNLDAEQAPYSVGFYTVAPSSIGVNRFKQLDFFRVALVPISEAKARVA